MAEPSLLDEAVRVTIIPSQASYFAGEVFAVNITITNTRRPETVLPAKSSSQSASYRHKRGAHSVSYVPIARPPTSPGVRTAIPAMASNSVCGTISVGRRGLVGMAQHAPTMDSVGAQVDPTRRRVVLTKSLSVSLAPQDLQPNGPNGQEDWKGKSPVSTLRAAEASLPGQFNSVVLRLLLKS